MAINQQQDNVTSAKPEKTTAYSFFFEDDDMPEYAASLAIQFLKHAIAGILFCIFFFAMMEVMADKQHPIKEQPTATSRP